MTWTKNTGAKSPCQQLSLLFSVCSWLSGKCVDELNLMYWDVNWVVNGCNADALSKAGAYACKTKGNSKITFSKKKRRIMLANWEIWHSGPFCSFYARTYVNVLSQRPERHVGVLFSWVVRNRKTFSIYTFFIFPCFQLTEIVRNKRKIILPNFRDVGIFSTAQ